MVQGEGSLLEVVPDRVAGQAQRVEHGGREVLRRLGIGGRLTAFAVGRSDDVEKGSVLDIVYSPPCFLRRYKRWFR